MMEPPTGEQRWSELRASDEERERVAAVLRRNYTNGRLSFEELSARLGKTLGARTFGELYALTQDLPHVAGPHPILEERGSLPDRSATSGRRAVARRALVWATFAAVLAVLVVVGALSGPGAVWPMWPAAGLVLGVLLARSVVRHSSRT